jgi:hypothetical protein
MLGHRLRQRGGKQQYLQPPTTTKMTAMPPAPEQAVDA